MNKYVSNKGIRIDAYDEEEMMFRDVINQLTTEKTSTAYVYNKNIIEKLKESIPNLEIKKKDFYWEIRRKDQNLQLLTAKKTYEALGITKPTFNSWIIQGCPYHNLGNRRYFILDEVEEWIKSK